jgi:hypothetical protein
VFDDFNETVENKLNLKNMDMWATRCSKDIMHEHANRKKVKKFAKEITQTRLQNELTEGASFKNEVLDEGHVLEDKMRLKYWDYFRGGNISLLEFMSMFKQLNTEMEKQTSDPQVLRANRNADIKIRKYIMFLERNIENALFEITRLRNMISKYAEPQSVPVSNKTQYTVSKL